MRLNNGVAAMKAGWIVAGFALALGSIPAAHADGKAGYDAWERGDWETALKNWRPLAIAGDAEAQYNMGQAYRLGRGVPVDLKIAEDWFRKSALAGNYKGRAAYGITMFQNGKRAEALPYLEEAAGHGDANAQYIYGTILFNGELVPRDYPRAYAMMTRASARGVKPAAAALAQMDRAIPKDDQMRGLALARAFELAESKPQGPEGPEVAATAGPASLPRRTTGPVRTTSLPPSEPAGLPPAPEEIGAPPVAPPVRIATPRPPVVKPPVVKPPVRVATAPTPAPRSPVEAASGGTWRVQLGAFSESARANALWTSLRGKIGALAAYQPMIVKAGPITRLQAGPLASRAAADKLCASVKAAGQACVPVTP